MYLTAEGLPSDRLRELAQHYTSGMSGPELQSFFSEVLQSNEVWKIGFLLISSSGISQEQFFGLSILNGAIRASSYIMSDEFTAEVRAAILRVVEDNTRMSQVSRADIRNSVLKKAFELLAQMLFRIEDFWSSPINDMFDLIGFDKTGSYSYILSFLTILLEEFVSTNLPFHMNGKVKQLILNSESLVFDLFQKLMASQSDEDVLIQVMTCCSTWISSLSLGSGALECSGLISLIYQTMSRSESLYLTGLDCLILLFEATGCGLSSGRITVKLLDFHILHLAALRNNMNNLLQAHAAAVENGLKWEEFEQCIPLTKSILLLHTFVEKQADQLVARVLSSSELACPLRDLLEMFLIPLSVRGHYPRDEVVSEYGAPIWFNLLDAVVTNRLEHQTESFGFQFLRDIQIRFLNAAFLKCHYPSDTNAYFLRWSSEEREEWHKSRSELGDNFMMAYSHQYSMDWFNELHENLSTVIVSCEFDSPTFQWQGLEAMLFILRSIHDQVSYEVAHENKASFQCALTVVQQSVHLISRLQPVLLGSTIEPRCDEWATGHCLLSCTLFDILCEYPPTLLSSELPAVAEYPTHQWCGAMLHFILSAFNGLPHLKVHREVKIALLHSTLKFFQVFIQVSWIVFRP
ncbi:unnamed protein product [Dicrocoelium dendriticum]|nr:unnamed protein product [Dicrocoelium dendriticum]